METVAHWTQNSIADFVYSISSNFVAQIETKIEANEISQNEIASKMNKTSGRVSQLLNNPGNLSIRVMAELAQALGMKVSIVAYDDGDHKNARGPIDPEVFVKSWEKLGRPADLFEVRDASLEVEEMPSIAYGSPTIQGHLIHDSHGLREFGYTYVSLTKPRARIVEPEPAFQLFAYNQGTLPPTQRKQNLVITQQPLPQKRNAA